MRTSYTLIVSPLSDPCKRIGACRYSNFRFRRLSTFPTAYGIAKGRGSGLEFACFRPVNDYKSSGTSGLNLRATSRCLTHTSNPTSGREVTTSQSFARYMSRPRNGNYAPRPNSTNTAIGSLRGLNLKSRLVLAEEILEKCLSQEIGLCLWNCVTSGPHGDAVWENSTKPWLQPNTTRTRSGKRLTRSSSWFRSSTGNKPTCPYFRYAKATSTRGNKRQSPYLRRK